MKLHSVQKCSLHGWPQGCLLVKFSPGLPPRPTSDEEMYFWAHVMRGMATPPRILVCPGVPWATELLAARTMPDLVARAIVEALIAGGHMHNDPQGGDEGG